jgi:hypothetical protein
LEAGKREAKGTVVLLPGIEGQEMRLYLPNDSAFFRMSVARDPNVTVYIPTVLGDGGTQVFRAVYGQLLGSAATEARLPAEWDQFRAGVYGMNALYRVPMRLREELESFPDATRVIAIWYSNEKYFKFDECVRDMILSKDPEGLRNSISANDSPEKAVVLFAAEQDELNRVNKAFAELSRATKGRVIYLYQ